MNLQGSETSPTVRLARRAWLGAACAALALSAAPAFAQSGPIRIGVPTAMQLQVGRDTQDAIKMAIDDLNAKGGVLGRKLEMVVADET
jgi:branched-chain amino acid transport system substrate-binding protein